MIAGAANTAATYLLYLILLHILPYLVAYSAAYGMGIVISYFLNAIYVFRTRPNFRAFFRFPIVYVVQFLLGAAVLWACVSQLGVPRELGLACAIAVTIPVTFAASRIALTGTLR